MTIYFTSDSHYGHANILKYTGRPFSDVHEMNKELTRRWNEVVGERDTVYHLGDFTLNGIDSAIKYFGKLNGVIKVLGYYDHHDKRWLKKLNSNVFSAGGHPVEILPPLHSVSNHQKIVMCHFPLAQWNQKHYGSWHLHGHCHGTFSPGPGSLDVGVDCHNFYPISSDQVKEILGGN